jgi:hypothetical protein
LLRRGVIQAWADECGATTLPAHPAHVAAYLTHRAAQGAKMATVRLAAAPQPLSARNESAGAALRILAKLCQLR